MLAIVTTNDAIIRIAEVLGAVFMAGIAWALISRRR